MRAGERTTLDSPIPRPPAARRGGQGRRVLGRALLAALLAIPLACGATTYIFDLFPPTEYHAAAARPGPAPRRPGTITPAAARTPAPKPTPAAAPAEGDTPAGRPGNPASWGEPGRLGVGREFDSIYFNGQSSELDPVARGRLDGYAAWLREHTQVWLTLAGHADRHAAGGYAYNLGMARALVAADYLIGMGIDRTRLFAISYGKDRPVATGKDNESDALNNRVEVTGFVAPLGQEAPAAASGEKQSPPEVEAPAPEPAGNELKK